MNQLPEFFYCLKRWAPQAKQQQQSKAKQSNPHPHTSGFRWQLFKMCAANLQGLS